MAKKQKSGQPTELELQILKVLWDADPDSIPMAVRDIRLRLAKSGRELAHTSVITMLNIMVRKKTVKRTKRKNAFYFTPLVEQEQIQSNVVNDVVTRVFDGSAGNLMLALLDRGDVDGEELRKIKELIDQKTKRAKSKQTNSQRKSS